MVVLWDEEAVEDKKIDLNLWGLESEFHEGKAVCASRAQKLIKMVKGQRSLKDNWGRLQ